MDAALTTLVGQGCAAKVLSFSDLSSPCYTLLASKLLGLIIVAGGLFLKLPQIAKLVRARSATGVNYAAYLLEMISYVFMLAYNMDRAYAFSTYGEMLFIAVQDLVILVLINRFDKKVFRMIVLVTVLVPLGICLFIPGLASSQLLGQLNMSSIAISTIAKLPQIATNFSNKSTGQLSAITVLMQTAGSLVRVFTTFREVNDPVLKLSIVLSASLNVVISSQLFIYSANTNAAAKAKKTDKPAKISTADKKANNITSETDSPSSVDSPRRSTLRRRTSTRK